MKNIIIPKTAAEYVDNVHDRAFPEPLLRGNDSYNRLIGWTLDNRTPLLYEQDHDSEYTNFSINFNWLLLRDYSRSKLGAAGVIATMYGLHEFTHMTHRLPTRLDTITANEYAEDFTRSEYRASNETEVLIHYRVPELRSMVLQGTKIAYDVMREKGIGQPSAKLLAAVRPLVVEHDVMKDFFADSPQDQAVYDRFKEFNGNRQWARERFDVIRPFFSGSEAVHSGGLADDEYEDVIATYEPHLDQPTYEANVVRNVKLGFPMCGLAVPELNGFADARTAAQDLEGRHAVVQL